MATLASTAQKPTHKTHKRLWMFVGSVVVLMSVLILLAPHKESVVAGFTARDIIFLLLVFFLAGLMSGLSGFGFSGVGAASLVLLPPILGTPVLQSLSTANQLLSVGQLREDMPKSWKGFWTGPGPYIIGGLPGSIIGVWMLTHLPAKELMLIFGSVLVLYSFYSIFRPTGALIRGGDGWLPGLGIGFLGGAFGGFTAFPGAAVVVWTSLRDLPRQQSRAIVQPYIIMSQFYALALLAYTKPAVFSHKYWVLIAMLAPAVLPGTATGVIAYRYLSDVNFKRISYFLLGLSGAVLLLKVLL